MKVLWICGLPNVVRLEGWGKVLSLCPTPAWSWIVGHLPPPPGVELHILCPTVDLIDNRIDFQWRGAVWHCFKRHPLKLLHHTIPYIINVWKFVRELAPDVVHGWGGETGFGYAATLLSKRSVVSVQGLLLLYCELSSKFKGNMKSFSGCRMIWRERQSYRRAKVLLTESKASQEALKQYYDEDSILIPHPLRKEFLQISLENRHSLVNMPIKIVFVGGLVDRKGAMDALKAFAGLQSSSAKMVFIGDGEKKEEMERFVDNYHMRDSISICSSRTPQEIVEEFRTAQFFLLPSYGDTGPTALKEALSCGLYPICYENSGPKALCAHYGCGGLCETGNVDALARLLKDRTAHVEKCLREGREAAMRVRGELGRDAVWKELLQVYATVMR